MGLNLNMDSIKMRPSREGTHSLALHATTGWQASMCGMEFH